MDILKIREEMKVKPLRDIRLRVAYYARVSTEKDEQLNSLKNQQQYYKEYIESNRNWELVDGYIDEGISGISVKHRERFHQMIDDAVNGKFDFIITKEISRFARNTLDSIQYTRKLLSNGVGVFFQNDNINTLDEDSEFRLTIMAGVAQDESRKLSSRIKFGHKQAIKNGVVMGNSRIYGYEKQKGKLVVNEKEAEMVKLIFEKYASGEYSTPMLEKLLYEKGYRNYSGRKINRGVIGHIITNPKYKGYYVGNKVKIVDMFTKKQKFLNSEDWVMWYDEDGETVPALIDEETWEKANRFFQNRSMQIKAHNCSYKHDNLFTSKIYCANDNAPYYLKARKNRKGEDSGTWCCSHKIKNGADSCSSFPVKQEELISILTQMLLAVYDNFDILINKYIEYYKSSQPKQEDSSTNIAEIEEEIAKIEIKKDKLLDLSLDGRISNAEFGKRNDTFNQKIGELEKMKSELIEKSKNQNNDLESLDFIRKTIKSYIVDGQLIFTQASINQMIERIYVKPIDKYYAEITIILRTGKEQIFPAYSKKIPKKPMSCFVNTFKKMIEAQEREMAQKNQTPSSK